MIGFYEQKNSEYTFFSIAHETFPRIDDIPGNKRSPSKFKSIEIISSIFSGHNDMKLEITTKINEMEAGGMITWRLSNILLKKKKKASMIKSKKYFL